MLHTRKRPLGLQRSGRRCWPTAAPAYLLTYLLTYLRSIGKCQFINLTLFRSLRLAVIVIHRSDVRLSVCPSVPSVSSNVNITRGAYSTSLTRGSMRRGQRTFRPDILVKYSTCWQMEQWHGKQVRAGMCGWWSRQSYRHLRSTELSIICVDLFMLLNK